MDLINILILIRRIRMHRDGIHRFNGGIAYNFETKDVQLDIIKNTSIMYVVVVVVVP